MTNVNRLISTVSVDWLFVGRFAFASSKQASTSPSWSIFFCRAVITAA